MSNILIRGCPGTGKTFFARAVAYYMCKKNMTEKDAFAQNPMDDAGEIEKFVNGTAQCEFIQIHPSMEFDDIVYGLPHCLPLSPLPSDCSFRFSSLLDKHLPAGIQKVFLILLLHSS